jgi:hypothetical protein
MDEGRRYRNREAFTMAIDVYGGRLDLKPPAS